MTSTCSTFSTGGIPDRASGISGEQGQVVHQHLRMLRQSCSRFPADLRFRIHNHHPGGLLQASSILRVFLPSIARLQHLHEYVSSETSCSNLPARPPLGPIGWWRVTGQIPQDGRAALVGQRYGEVFESQGGNRQGGAGRLGS